MITALLGAASIAALIGTHQLQKRLDARLAAQAAAMEAARQRVQEAKRKSQEGQS